MEELKYSEYPEYKDFVNTFIQRDSYVVKQIGKDYWKTKNKPLSDVPIKAHLNGQYYVGVKSKWYPSYAIFDFDDMKRDDVEDIREKFGLDCSNSMLDTSGSPNSYHLLFGTVYNGKPPTIRLQNQILKPAANENGIEIYPQTNRMIKLPYGYNQNCIDKVYLHLETWKQQFNQFSKLLPYELKNFPLQQMQFELNEEIGFKPKGNTFTEGKYLYENGLVTKNSRNESQFKVLYYLHMSMNIPPETAVSFTWNWIRNKNNGYSTDIRLSPHIVKKEIERQAINIWGKYERNFIYPNEVNNSHNGYVTKADIIEILMINQASIPGAKFLFNLLKYYYPRRHRTQVNIHSDILKTWSMKGYISQLEALQSKGIIKRCDSYQAEVFSKSIKINWDFKDISQAILIDGRAPDTWEDTIRAEYKPEEFREHLIRAGSERTAAIKTVSRIF